MYIYIYIYICMGCLYVHVYNHVVVRAQLGPRPAIPAPQGARRTLPPWARAAPTPSPPTKSLGFRGFDSSRLLILRVRILMSVEFYRESPGKFDSRTLSRKSLNRWTGRIVSMCMMSITSITVIIIIIITITIIIIMVIARMFILIIIVLLLLVVVVVV